MNQAFVFRVTEPEVWAAALEQGVSLTFGEIRELCDRVGDALDNRVPEIIKDEVGDYIYEKEGL